LPESINGPSAVHASSEAADEGDNYHWGATVEKRRKGRERKLISLNLGCGEDEHLTEERHDEWQASHWHHFPINFPEPDLVYYKI
jgi:hypothetical protein